MEEQITVDRALEITIDILNKINVPIFMIEQIGVPIRHAVNNIAQCVEALRNNGKQPEPEFLDAGFEEKKEDLPQADKIIEMGRDPDDGSDYAE